MLGGISTSYLNRMYPEEWVLAEVLESDARKRPTRIRVIAHSQNRQDIQSVLLQAHGHIVLLFVGAPRVPVMTF